jgi:hypothetical protein
MGEDVKRENKRRNSLFVVSFEAVTFLDQLPVGRYLFQEGAAQALVLDPGRPLLQEAAGGAQDLSGAGVVVSPQDPVAGPVDAERFVGAVEGLGPQVLQDLVDQGLVVGSASPGPISQADQGVAQEEGRIPLTEVVARRSILQRLLSVIPGRLVVAFGVADQIQRSQPPAISTALGYLACYSSVGAVLELKQS